MDRYEYFLSVPLIKLWRSNAMSCYNFIQVLKEKLALPLKEGLVHLTEAFTCMKLTTDSSNVVKKEIKPVTPKRNQSWIFIGRTDAEAEAPMLQPPDAKNWLIEKDPDAGKDWKWEEKGTTEDKMFGCHHLHAKHRHESEQGSGVGDRQGRLHATVHGVTESWTQLSDWTEMNINIFCMALNIFYFQKNRRV